ncbi:uncharacterized protein LOC105761998 [Gossypium raimondii]|uniref:uncharacterized protein LOC105761998 n=1 Tax=Gossypium raimondii TaxID=29730 RepID=UPI00063A880F|nr:uncharacterized protein LOC105761998 [Gossypium raimondii]
MDSNRADFDNVESNAQASVHGAASSSSRPAFEGRGGEVREVFFQMMNEWFTKFVRTNLAAQRPPPPPIPQPVLIVPQVLKEQITWEFFQIEFIKKYISQRFLDQKRKEFLELKQGRMTVSKYEREFVRLTKYTREYIPTKIAMCKRFEDGLNEDIKLLVRILELKEFVVLVDRAHKAEELSKEKIKDDSAARDSRKRSTGKLYHSSSKRSKDYHNRSTALVGYLSRDRGKQHVCSKAQATSVASVGSAKANKPNCQRCG